MSEARFWVTPTNAGNMAIVFCKRALNPGEPLTDEDGVPLYSTGATIELNAMREEIAKLRADVEYLEKTKAPRGFNYERGDEL